MSTKFDWAQFEEIPQETAKSTFDWNQFEEIPEEKKRLSLSKVGFEKRVSGESRVPEMKRTLGRSGKVVAGEVLGLPGDIASLAGRGLSKLEELSPFHKEGTEDQLKEVIENPFTSGKIKEKIENVFPSTRPLDQTEKDWEENLGLLTSLVIPVPGGKAKAINPKTRNALYQAGKRIGLTEKELTPLFKGKISQNILGKLTQSGEEAIANLKLTQDALGDVYQTIKTSPSASQPIPKEASDYLIRKIGEFKTSLGKTLAMSPERKSMVTMLDEAQEFLKHSGSTPEELINFYQDINKSVNWNSIKGGKKQLSEVKDFIKSALKTSDPILAQQFETANKLWGKSESVIKSIGREQFNKFLNIGAYTALVGALATGNLDYAQKIGLGIAGKKALGKVATKLLTDPKWQNLHGKLLQAIKNKSPKAAQVIIQTLRTRADEEMPEDSAEIDWDAFRSS